VSEVVALAQQLGEALVSRRHVAATAESCTGGLVAAAITAVAGSSAWFDRGFVTYSDAAKQELLGVPMALVRTHGAVSEVVARAMAEGALSRSRADVAVSITGIAGPGGGSAAKPVGLVCFGVACRGTPARATTHQFAGDRGAVREAAVRAALQALIDATLA
jgi:nicotinamide-nucleotide amidase